MWIANTKEGTVSKNNTRTLVEEGRYITRPDKGGTSTDKTDVKAWGSDDCVAWYTDFPDATVQRPVAWTTGTRDPTTCQYVDQRVWTTTGKNGGAGTCREGGVWVHTKGRVWMSNSITRFDYATKQWATANASTSGGIAQDLQGRIWAAGQNGLTKAYKIDPNTFAYEFYDGLNGPYTYSDMTGGQISNVECNPPEG